MRAWEKLNKFKGEDVKGDWTLEATAKSTLRSIGRINNFEIEYCADLNIVSPILINNGPLQLNINETKVIDSPLLLSQDADNTADQLTYTLISPTNHGSLKLNGVALPLLLSYGSTFTQKDIDSGKISYSHDGKVVQGETYDPAIFESKKCDFIAGNISPVEWRKKLMDLNWIYIRNMMVLVRKEDKKKFKKVSDLKGKTVTVIPGTTYYDWLMDFQKELKESENMCLRARTVPGIGPPIQS